MAHDTGVPASPMPGWYPDPAGSAELRWWDGAQWLNRTQPATWDGPAPVAPTALALRGQRPGPGSRPHRGYTSPFAAPGPGTAAYVPAHAAGAPVPWAWAVAAVPLLHLEVAVVSPPPADSR